MIRIYGASDDLVEIEGHDDGDEHGCYDRDVYVRLGDASTGGVAIRMTYAPDLGALPGGEDVGFACWSAEVGQLAEDCPIPWPVTITTQGRRKDDVGYSVCVQVDAPSTVPMVVEKVNVHKRKVPRD